MYGYLERKNRLELGSKYNGDNIIGFGRSFKYDKWSTQDFIKVDSAPIDKFQVLGNPL